MQVFRDIGSGIGLMISSPLTYLGLTTVQFLVLLVLEGRQMSALPFSDLDAGFGKSFGELLDLAWLLDSLLLLGLVFLSNWLFLYFIIMAAARQVTADSGAAWRFLIFRRVPLIGLFVALVLAGLVTLVAMVPVSTVLVPVALMIAGGAEADSAGWMSNSLAFIVSMAVTSAVYAIILSWFIASPVRDALLAIGLPAIRDRASLENAGRRRIFQIHFLATMCVGLVGYLVGFVVSGGGLGHSWMFLQCLFAVTLPAVASVVAMARVFQAERPAR